MHLKELLSQVKLNSHPQTHDLLLKYYIEINFKLASTKIKIMHEENIPQNQACIFLLNHTSRYDSWPFQYLLWKLNQGYAANWIKTPFFENPFLRNFLLKTNNIPVPSKSYLIKTHFQNFYKREPSKEEYRIIKNAFNQFYIQKDFTLNNLFQDFFKFYKDEYTFFTLIQKEFEDFMLQITHICQEGLKNGVHMIIYPEGQRNKTLGEGRTGAAQFALTTRAPVIPVGAQGTREYYSKNIPLSKKGEILFRIGKPIDYQSFLIHEEFTPYTAESEIKYKENFQNLTNLFMKSLAHLLDKSYLPEGMHHLSWEEERF